MPACETKWRGIGVPTLLWAERSHFWMGNGCSAKAPRQRPRGPVIRGWHVLLSSVQ